MLQKTSGQFNTACPTGEALHRAESCGPSECSCPVTAVPNVTIRSSTLSNSTLLEQSSVATIGTGADERLELVVTPSAHADAMQHTKLFYSIHPLGKAADDLHDLANYSCEHPVEPGVLVKLPNAASLESPVRFYVIGVCALEGALNDTLPVCGSFYAFQYEHRGVPPPEGQSSQWGQLVTQSPPVKWEEQNSTVGHMGTRHTGLSGKCVSKDVGKYEYEICHFEQVTQVRLVPMY